MQTYLDDLDFGYFTHYSAAIPKKSSVKHTSMQEFTNNKWKTLTVKSQQWLVNKKHSPLII